MDLPITFAIASRPISVSRWTWNSFRREASLNSPKVRLARARRDAFWIIGRVICGNDGNVFAMLNWEEASCHAEPF